ncbi:MAG: RNA polymerase sigma-54 factor, partial [Candidatus Cloacimonadota bacterium]|nr:RNA polymerase sigma-54 factor [Candidatus Cloacimonadota bacterium]
MAKIYQGISQKQTQNLKLKPKMLQSLNMLAMPVLDLDVYLKKELIENPMLEVDDPNNDIEDSPDKQEKDEVEEGEIDSEDVELQETIEEAQELSEALDHWDDMNYTGREHVKSKENDFEPKKLMRSVTKKLDDYINNFYDLDLTNDQKDFGYDLIDSIDSYGFLHPELDIYKLAEEYDFDNEQADFVHNIILNLTPKGITSRSITECLLCQIPEEYSKDRTLKKMIEIHFDDLIHRKKKQIVSKLKISEMEFIEYRNIISKFDPKPGLRILQDDSDYVVPDLIVRKFDNQFVVMTNDKYFPKIVLSKSYKNIVSKIKKDRTATTFVRNKINSAKFLVKSMYMRGRTLKRVMYSIIEHQKNFFYEDEQIMVPLVYSA